MSISEDAFSQKIDTFYGMYFPVPHLSQHNREWQIQIFTEVSRRNKKLIKG